MEIATELAAQRHDGESAVYRQPTVAPDLRFCNELGVIPVLFFVGTKCRDPTVRRQALHALRSMRRREGPWDSAMAARIIEAQIDYEEGLNDPNFDFSGGMMPGIPSFSRLGYSSIQIGINGPQTVKVTHLLHRADQQPMQIERIVAR